MIADPSDRERTFSSDVIARILSPSPWSTSMLIDLIVRDGKICFDLVGLVNSPKILIEFTTNGNLRFAFQFQISYKLLFLRNQWLLIDFKWLHNVKSL